MLIRFTTFDKRLLFDARSDQEEGPIVRVVPRAGSAAERFKHLKGLRPRFPLPKNIVSFTWPKHVNSLERLGDLAGDCGPHTQHGVLRLRRGMPACAH